MFIRIKWPSSEFTVISSSWYTEYTSWYTSHAIKLFSLLNYIEYIWVKIRTFIMHLKIKLCMCVCVCVHDDQSLPLKLSEKHFSKIQEEDWIKSLEKIIVFSFGECSSSVWARNLMPQHGLFPSSQLHTWFIHISVSFPIGFPRDCWGT